MISRYFLLLKWSFLCPGTSVLGQPVVRLERRHILHSWTCPHLVGKVLVIAPDSHWASRVSSNFFAFCLQGLWTLLLWYSAAAVFPSQDWLCSSQKNGCLHRAVYGRSSCQNHISGELFVIAFLSDVLLKSFLLKQLVLFQCTVVILVCNCLYWKMVSLWEWHVMNNVYSCKLGPALGWGRNETWQGTTSRNRLWAHAPI